MANFPILWYTRLRAVSYFSLQSYCTRNLTTRAAKPRAARNEGVSQSVIVIITSWFAVALDEIRSRRILREKADCKESIGILSREIPTLLYTGSLKKAPLWSGTSHGVSARGWGRGGGHRTVHPFFLSISIRFPKLHAIWLWRIRTGIYSN